MESRHLRLIAATGLLCVGFAAVGCSDENPNTTTSSGSTSSSSSGGGGGGSGGTGGSGGGATGTAQLEAAVKDIIPFDAAPDGKGDNVYVVGLDAMGNAVISQGKMDGSAASKALWTGTPLVAPLNVAVSTDNATVYVTDPGAEDPNGNYGRLFNIPAAGGAIAIVTNADGYRARGLEIASEDGKDMIYFAGTNPAGEPGIFKVPADDSAAVTTIAKGSPLQDPSGVVVSKTGDVYACDTVQDSDGMGSIVGIKGGAATTIATGVRAGFPCGVALTDDESTLLVSAIDPIKHTDTVILINLSTNALSYFADGIDTFVESAGLHRAKQGGNTFAWADTTNGSGVGTVFKVTFK